MTTLYLTSPRLPLSLKAAVEKLAKRDGTSVNQFVVVAVAEAIGDGDGGPVRERRARADMQAFDRVMDRAGGEPPRPDDELEPAPAMPTPATIVCANPCDCMERHAVFM